MHLTATKLRTLGATNSGFDRILVVVCLRSSRKDPTSHYHHALLHAIYTVASHCQSRLRPAEQARFAFGILDADQYEATLAQSFLIYPDDLPTLFAWNVQVRFHHTCPHRHFVVCG